MDIIKTLKDVIEVAQKSNDIELIKKVISAQQSVIDLQDKIGKLHNENERLKSKIKKNESVERYRNIPIITLKTDEKKVLYCGVCYGNSEKLIPVQKISRGTQCYCNNCKTSSYIDNSPDEKVLMEGLN